MKKIVLPILDDVKKELRARDYILLSGKLYTMRDAAHRRILEMKREGLKLPIGLENACIYYTGPTPKKNNRIGAIGPTTSYRMDSYMKELTNLNCTIGKGPRSEEVKNLAKTHHLIYLMAIGGLGAKLSLAVKSMELVAFPELGPEAIYELEVEDFPVIVAYDIYGNSIFTEGKSNER
ncbi:MAG TPA: TRZ/ATZ family protein [Acholeplasmataceae bacterium]|jgi:fumarate hydratase subunit beta|nr:TRZ/ATZ family protein [Acholeplasmataceae bacterium]